MVFSSIIRLCGLREVSYYAVPQYRLTHVDHRQDARSRAVFCFFLSGRDVSAFLPRLVYGLCTPSCEARFHVRYKPASAQCALPVIFKIDAGTEQCKPKNTICSVFLRFFSHYTQYIDEIAFKII